MSFRPKGSRRSRGSRARPSWDKDTASTVSSLDSGDTVSTISSSDSSDSSTISSTSSSSSSSCSSSLSSYSSSSSSSFSSTYSSATALSSRSASTPSLSGGRGGRGGGSAGYSAGKEVVFFRCPQFKIVQDVQVRPCIVAVTEFRGRPQYKQPDVGKELFENMVRALTTLLSEEEAKFKPTNTNCYLEFSAGTWQRSRAFPLKAYASKQLFEDMVDARGGFTCIDKDRTFVVNEGGSAICEWDGVPVRFQPRYFLISLADTMRALQTTDLAEIYWAVGKFAKESLLRRLRGWSVRMQWNVADMYAEEGLLVLHVDIKDWLKIVHEKAPGTISDDEAQALVAQYSWNEPTRQYNDGKLFKDTRNY